jgi:hypothetical protein
MQSIVMETCPDLEGWTTSEYKEFKYDDRETNSDTDDDDDQGGGVVVRGYSTSKYNKILFIEELLPE